MHRERKWFIYAIVLCGLILCLVGGTQFIAPTGFFATNGITLPKNPGLYSEIRVGGSGILLIGLFMVLSLRMKHWRHTAGLIGAALYLGAALARILSWGLDGGMPSNLYVPFALEVILGLVLLYGQRPVR